MNAEIQTDIIDELANSLKTGNYELEPVLKTLFKSTPFL